MEIKETCTSLCALQGHGGKESGVAMTKILEANGLSKQYDLGEVTVNALQEVDFLVQKGEFVAIMGPSGSGKSTLLHLLGGLDVPSRGEISLAGHRLSLLDDDEVTIMRRREVGFVFQFFNLLPTLTALENVALPLLLDGIPRRQYEEQALKVLRIVGLEDRAKHKPSQLSGGEQQRVAIARAMVTEPQILLTDEPTGNLDTAAGDRLLKLLRKACDEYGQTIVMVTHDPNAAVFADRIVFLLDGKIVDEIWGERVNIQSITKIIAGLDR
jgi:putative ABC transport system ATP-binding protein